MRSRTVPSFDVLLGFDQRPQSTHFLPFQLVQLRPDVVAHEVQLFSQFPLLEARHQIRTT